MYHASYLCGAVSYEIHGPIEDVVYCHCSQCRKVQGSAFATNGNVKVEDFRLIGDENILTEYQSSRGNYKYFCKQCGSPIMNKKDNRPDVVRIRLGTIVSDISERPTAHIFVTSKANWDHICDDLPQFEKFADH